MSESTTYLSARKAAEYVDAPSVEAFRKWVRRHAVPSLRYGRNLRFLRRDLDEALGNTRVRKAGFQSRASHFQQGQRALHAPHVASDPIRDVHAAQDAKADTGSQRNSIVAGTR